MKFFWPVLLLFSVAGNAQDSNPDILPNEKLKLIVERIAPAEIKFPFSSIKIIDNRFDTSKLGFRSVYQLIRYKKRAGRKIIVEGGLANTLEGYYNEFYEKSFSATDLKLLVVIKKLWLSKIDDEKNKDMDIVKNNKTNSFLYCKWEYYFNKGDKYYPFKRLDTVVNGVLFKTEKGGLTHFDSDKKVLELILKGLIETVDFITPLNNIDRLLQKSWIEVEKFNKSFYNIPVLSDTVIAKGVFLNFNEFKQNKPSITNFKEEIIRLKAGKTENYLTDDKGIRIANYWGYNTGKYIKIGKYGNDEIYRKYNTFEFFAIFQYLTINNSILPMSMYKDKEFWIPYQVDMETGEIY